MNQNKSVSVSAKTRRSFLPSRMRLSGELSQIQDRDWSHWPLTFAAGISAMMNFLIPVLMVRYLAPVDVGIFRIFALYVSVFPSVSLIVGFQNGLSLWGGHGSEGRKKIQLIGSILLIYSLLLWSLALGIQPLISAFKDLNFLSYASLSFAICFLPLASFYEAASIAIGSVNATAALSLGFDVLKASLVTSALVYGQRLELLFYAYALWTAFKVGFSLLFSIKKDLIKVRWDRRTFRAVLNYSLPVSLAGIFGFFTNYVDKFLLSRSLSASEFALYAIGCLSIPPLLSFEISVHNVLIPKLSEAMRAKKSELGYTQINRLYQKSVTDLALILVPAAVGLWVFAVPIIELLFTKSYVAGATFLKLYSIFYILLCFPVDSLARAAGDNGWIFKNSIVVGLVSLLTIGLGVWFGGAIGGLVGFLLAQTFYRFQAIIYAKEKLGWPWLRQFPVSKVLLFITTSSLLGGLSLVVHRFFLSDLIWFFFCGPMFAIVYFLVIYLAPQKYGQGEAK